MKKYILLLTLLTNLFAETLEIPIQHPASIMVYNFTSKDTEIKDRVKVSLFESNIFEVSDKHKIDFELTTLNLNYSKVINENSQIDITVPIHYVWRGFLDKPLHEFHNLVNQSTSRDRHNESKNRVNLSILNGEILNVDSSYLSLSNIQIEHKIYLDRYKKFDIALIYGAKVPLAEGKSKYFTTGKIDFMGGVIFDYIRENYKMTFNTLFSYNSNYSLKNIIESRDFRASLFFGYEREFLSGDFMFEYQINTSPFKSTLKGYDKIVHILNLGYREKLKSGHITYFISENLEPFKNSPDLTIGMSYSF